MIIAIGIVKVEDVLDILEDIKWSASRIEILWDKAVQYFMGVLAVINKDVDLTRHSTKV